MIIQHIKAKHLRAGYKVKTKEGKLVRIKLIKKVEGKPESLYIIIFDTGSEVALMENETLPISFEFKR